MKKRFHEYAGLSITKSKQAKAHYDLMPPELVETSVVRILCFAITTKLAPRKRKHSSLGSLLKRPCKHFLVNEPLLELGREFLYRRVSAQFLADRIPSKIGDRPVFGALSGPTRITCRLCFWAGGCGSARTDLAGL